MDRIKRNARYRAYLKRRYAQRMSDAKLQLGGACRICGAVENLQFDHIDPATKTKNISAMTYSSDAVFALEVAKCQLLCQPCHEAKSLKDAGLESRRGVHGTYTNYKHHGCRCQLCRRANAEQHRIWRSRHA